MHLLAAHAVYFNDGSFVVEVHTCAGAPIEDIRGQDALNKREQSLLLRANFRHYKGKFSTKEGSFFFFFQGTKILDAESSLRNMHLIHSIELHQKIM